MNNIHFVDNVILRAMADKNQYIIRQFGDICVLLQRKQSGSVVPQTTVSSYTNTGHTKFQLWQGNPGGTQSSNHPDIRYDINDGSGFITITKDDIELTRVPEKNVMDDDSEYKIYTDVSGSVFAELYSSGSVVSYSYTTICHCVDPSKSQAKTRCTTCYSTMYEGGYVVSGSVATAYNPSGTILVRIPPAYSDMKVESVRQLREDEQNEAWTLADPTYPVVSDFDMIVPLTGDHVGTIFQVTNVRMSHLRTHNLSQKFQVHNMPETDIIYEFPIPDYGSLTTYTAGRTYGNLQ